MKKKILLVDVDSKIANLALMKISAHHKKQGDIVELIKGIPTTAPLEPYDKTYISCIFFQNKEKVLDYVSQLDNVVLGGSGIDLDIKLDNDIEHIMPDYELYSIDYSIGFTSRGCIRNCDFCIVPEKEGMITDHAPISEFHHQDHKKVILLDNNFLASPQCENNLTYIYDNSLKVNFNQGLDIRLVNDHNAEWLSNIKYYNHRFKVRSLHFAFDHPSYKDSVVRGIETLESYGIPRRHLMFYILVGYNTTQDQDLDRIYLLKELNVIPFVMRYNNDTNTRDLARWVNRFYYQMFPYHEYKSDYK